jgi:hypothetical protein
LQREGAVALCTVLNENEEIRGQRVKLGKGQEHQRGMFEGIRDALTQFGHSLIDFFWVDDVPSQRNLLESIFASLLRGVKAPPSSNSCGLPTARLPADIEVFFRDTENGINDAVTSIMVQFSAQNQSGKTFLGFDTEHPSNGGPQTHPTTSHLPGPGRVSLLQFACETRVYVFQVS